MPTANLPALFPIRTVARSLAVKAPPPAKTVVPREAPSHPIRALHEGAGTGLPALLLGSKTSRYLFGRAGVSPFSMPALKMLSGPPMKML
jgi:hypothetical protein